MLCKICHQKQANAKHLATHGLTYAEYIKQYEPEKQQRLDILDRLTSMYIVRRDKYIKFHKKANHWVTLISNPKRGIPPLSKQAIEDHLRFKDCYGIITNSAETHLLVFDIDFESPIDSLKALYSVTNCLMNMGLNSNQMLCSWSGRRGYHIALFFDKEISKKYAVQLYEYVIKLTGYSKKEVEGKGIGGTGVKLPLGVNFKNTGDELPNHCYLTDTKGNKVSDSQLVFHLDSIKKVPEKWVTNVLSNQPQVVTSEQKKQYKEATKQDIAALAIQDILDEVAGDDYYEMTEEKLQRAFEYKLQHGIQALGTRHNTAFFLAIYMKDLKGMNEAEIVRSLYEWTRDVCKPQFYKTPLNKIEEEMTRMVASIFKNNYVWKQAKRHITLTPKDQINIVFGKNGKMLTKTDIKTMFIFTRHSKYYADDEGVFYLTYKQFAQLTKKDPDKQVKANRERLKARFLKLEEMGKLQIVESGVYVPGQVKKAPNKYKVLDIDDTYKLKVSRKIKDLKVCTCPDVNLDKVIDTIKANVTGKAGRRAKLCKCGN